MRNEKLDLAIKKIDEMVKKIDINRIDKLIDECNKSLVLANENESNLHYYYVKATRDQLKWFIIKLEELKENIHTSNGYKITI